ncbi:FxsA family protein [Spongiibacter taiwanensis]|uniref:FxsA family protein n=1 Tax=Spongiibacter taiwanensis TaxID=1748242 RepID=UPI00203598BE|nr:FxsA family protein [Spongiibacter taiwanensis]USA44221.1 FxsA family protein [Spongiibacter taiwanensis]
MRILFGLFIVLPVLEMWLLIKVGGVIGALPTVGLVLLTAVIGANLLRSQGFSTLTRAQQRLNSGELPATEMLEGIFLAVGGALLLTPGFVTDAIGFCCLLPALRRGLIGAMLKRGMVQMSGGMYSQGGFGGGSTAQRQNDASPGGNGPVTIEGEYKKEE